MSFHQFPSSPLASHRAKPKADDPRWLELKDTIYHLYIVGNKKLEDIMSIMKQQYGFDATKSQYTTKFSAWKWKKNSNAETYRGISGALKRRNADISEADVTVDGKKITFKKLKKELPRYCGRGRHPESNGNDDQDGVVARTPEHVVIGVSAPPKLLSIKIDLPWYTFLDTAVPSLASSFATLNSKWSPNPPWMVDPNVEQILPSSHADLDSNGALTIDWYQELPGSGLDFDLVPTVSEEARYTTSSGQIIKRSHVKQAQLTAVFKSKLLDCLRPYVIERGPNETSELVKQLTDPKSITTLHFMMPYLALLLSHVSVEPDFVRYFTDKLVEMPQFWIFEWISRQESPYAKSIASRLLHAAVEQGKIDFVKAALNRGANIESPSPGTHSCTLLQVALNGNRNEHAEIVDMLLISGADVNIGLYNEDFITQCSEWEHRVPGHICECERHGEHSPVALAAGSGACVDLIPRLLDSGAIMPECNVLLEAIIQGASTATVRTLLKAGEDPNQCRSAFWGPETTPLSAAATHCNSEIVALLLKAGANANGTLAAEFWPLYKEDCSDDPPIWRSPLLCALLAESPQTEGNRLSTVQLLLEHGAEPNLAPLQFSEELEDSEQFEVFAARYNPYYSSKWEDESELFGRFQDELSGHTEFGPLALVAFPLQAATALEDPETAECLLRFGATVNTQYGIPALTIAVHYRRLETVRLLLENDADPNAFGQHLRCQSALQAAVENEDMEMIKLLVLSGADIDKCPAVPGGRTPLQHAAESGNIPMVEHLLKLRACLHSDVARIGGISVLQGFVESRNHEYIRHALEAGVSPNQNSKWGRTPLSAAVINNDLRTLRLLIKADARLHDYSFPGFSDDEGRDEYAHLSDGYGTAPMLSPIQWASWMNHMEAAEILVEAGANVNQAPHEYGGYHALHLAILNEHYLMADFLISRGASTDVRLEGKSALQFAVESRKSRVVKCLLQHGADPNQSCLIHPEYDEPSTILEWACRHGSPSTVEVLLEAGADPNVGVPLIRTLTVYNETRCTEVIKLLLHGADAGKRESDDFDTPLQRAIMRKYFQIAHCLIDKGADINASPSKAKEGRTALQAAASVGNVDLVEHLLRKKADVNAPAAVNHGVTALQAAAIQGYLRIAQILLQHGADIDAGASPIEGCTAIEGAAEFGNIDMVKLLLDNYHGPKPLDDWVRRAKAAAKKGNQWHVTELLETYQPPVDDVESLQSCQPPVDDLWPYNLPFS
ncbi:hypothetical protein H2200_007303 [Cladophialophora chaetospira]|uniref:Clr5 domain-containing protein n=1 Tax=Cladophialophora chaetospira TaxID=386627 RepID=A0AA38X7J5_9EURO|nr:hypothetical protein H2200_007303 [Cladophialophora chaetospira]